MHGEMVNDTRDPALFFKEQEMALSDL